MQAVVVVMEECKINRHNFEIFAELIARISHSLWMRGVLPFTMPPPPATAVQDDTLMPQFTHKHTHTQIHRGQDRTGTTEPVTFIADLFTVLYWIVWTPMGGTRRDRTGPHRV